MAKKGKYKGESLQSVICPQKHSIDSGQTEAFGDARV